MEISFKKWYEQKLDEIDNLNPRIASPPDPEEHAKKRFLHLLRRIPTALKDLVTAKIGDLNTWHERLEVVQSLLQTQAPHLYEKLIASQSKRRPPPPPPMPKPHIPSVPKNPVNHNLRRRSVV